MCNKLLQKFSSLSLRTHLVIITCVFSIPAFALIIQTSLDQRQDALDNVMARTRKLSYDIANEQINLTTGAEQLATVLAQLPQVQEHHSEYVNKLLSRILQQNPRYGNIVITDTTGMVWASGLHMTTPFSLSSFRTFQNAMKTRQFSTGEYVIGKISAKPTIGFGYPVLRPNGELAGVIALNINFTHFNEILSQAGLPEGTVFSLTDFNGIIINRNREPERFIGKKMNDDIFMSMVRGADEGSLVGYETGDTRQIIAYRKLKMNGENHPYLYIRVGVPLRETYEKTVKDQSYSLGIMLSLFGAALLIALLIAKYGFIDRISVLRSAAQRLADGDLNIRVSDLVTGGELGELGHSFDEMAHQIAEREQALRISEAEYRVLADHAADIIWRLDTDGRIDYISPADERLRGFSSSEVIGKHLEQMMSAEDAKILELAHINRLELERSGVKTGDLSFEFRLLRKDGGTLWADILSSPVRGDDEQIVGYIGIARDITERKKLEAEREKLVEDLQEAVAKIKTLSGMLPICASCKKIRDDQGYWNILESYISKHTDASFSHGICPDCAKKAYDEIEQMDHLKM